DEGDAGYINGSRFTTGASAGTVTSMSVHVGNVSAAPNNQYELAIYSDDNGRPGSLVARSPRRTLAPNACNTLPVHATLRPNSAHRLMNSTNREDRRANHLNYRDGDVPQAYSSRSVVFGTWPERFGKATTASGAFSIYATYASSAAASAPDTSPNWLALLLVA